MSTFHLCSKLCIAFQYLLVLQAFSIQAKVCFVWWKSMSFINALFGILIWWQFFFLYRFFCCQEWHILLVHSGSYRSFGLVAILSVFNRHGEFTPHLFLEFCARSFVLLIWIAYFPSHEGPFSLICFLNDDY